MKKQTGSIDLGSFGGIIAIAVLILSAGGWVANIVKFIHIVDNPITGMFIARIVGIFMLPFGAILGYF